MNVFSLVGRTVLVTGASRGIGLSIAEVPAGVCAQVAAAVDVIEAKVAQIDIPLNAARIQRRAPLAKLDDNRRRPRAAGASAKTSTAAI